MSILISKNEQTKIIDEIFGHYSKRVTYYSLLLF